MGLFRPFLLNLGHSRFIKLVRQTLLDPSPILDYLLSEKTPIFNHSTPLLFDLLFDALQQLFLCLLLALDAMHLRLNLLISKVDLFGKSGDPQRTVFDYLPKMTPMFLVVTCHSIQHLVHTASIFGLSLNNYRLYMTLIIVVHLVNLVFEELIIITFPPVNQTTQSKQQLEDNTLDRSVVGGSVIAFLVNDVADTEEAESQTASQEISQS